MFEIELFICIKMDLALNNLQRLIPHKPKQTNITDIHIFIHTHTHTHTHTTHTYVYIDTHNIHTNIAQLVGVMEYTDCISVEG